MPRGLARAAAAVTVVVLAAVGVVSYDGSVTSGLPGLAPSSDAPGTATDDSIPSNDDDGVRFASCTAAVVEAADERVEVELTAHDGGTQLHTYENVSGTTTFTVSKAGRSPDRWFISGIGVGPGTDYVAALSPYYSPGRTGESSCESPGA